MEAWGDPHAISPPSAERNPRLHCRTKERSWAVGRATRTMASCRHHSGYLADDEAGHTAYMARVSMPVRP